MKLKNTIRTIILFSGCLLSLISKAQNDKVIIEKIYDDPLKNKWNVGLALGFDIQSKTSGGLYYMIHSRYTLSKLLTFNLTAALDLTKLSGGKGIIKTGEIYSKLDPYRHIEARATYIFSDKINESKGKANLGSDGKYTYSTTYTSKSRAVMGATASLNLHNHIGGQMDDSTSDKRAYNIVNGNFTGFKSNTIVNQKNIILGVGFFFGEYAHSKYKFSAGPVGTKKAKVKKSISTAIEFLLALNVNVGDKAYYDNNGTVEEYKITDVEKRRMGFRIITDYGKNKPGWYQHFELGMRPGLYSPNKQSKTLNQGYINWGFGIGF